MSAREDREAVAAAEDLHAISWCLRAVACGYGLLPAERAACLTILAGGIPGTDAADLQTAEKLLQAPRRLGSRQRDQASDLSVRLAEWVETLRLRT